MGYHSWECKVCGLSLRSQSYMPLVASVAVLPDGSVEHGDYDGYGRLGGINILDQPETPDCYHLLCWEHIGQPTKYTGGSEDAHDQGFFFEESDPDVEYDKLQGREW